MRDAGTPRTLSRAVYAAIRAEILAGRYAPGAKLSTRVIAAQYQGGRVAVLRGEQARASRITLMPDAEALT